MLRHLTAVTRSNRWALATGLALFVGSSAQAADWADLQITFVYDAAKVPERAPVDMSRDAVCVQTHADAKPLSEELLVDPATKGIKNVAFYPDTKKAGIEAGDVHPDLKTPSAEPVSLDNNKCVFIPHVLAVRPGQTIKVLNSDQTGHNANFGFFNNDAINAVVPVGGFKDIQVVKGERAPTPVECNIHPWMKAHVLIFDLPYSGLSDEKGVLKIEKLPAGKPITFKIWHENMDKSIDQVNFGGKDVEWSKGNVELTLKPGMNDLGVVKIKADKFKTK
jgi:plastocyanin